MSDPRTFTPRQLVITELKEVASGTSSKGAQWTLKKVTATTTAGDEIRDRQTGQPVKLTTFQNPALNTPLYFLVKPYHKDNKLESYQLEECEADGKKKSSSGARLGPKVDAIDGRVKTLEQQVEQLTTAVQTLMRATPDAGKTQTFPAADDDIPF